MNTTNTTIRALLLGAALVGPLMAQAVTTVTTNTTPNVIGGVGTAPGSWFTGQGNVQAYNTTGNVALNKAVTVSNTISGYSPIHMASNLTDGFYGNGSSWIDATTSSPVWFTVDLGSAMSINSLTIGRDRTGHFVNERNPGTILVESSLDNTSFGLIWNSSNAIAFANAKESLNLAFDPMSARYVRVTLGSNQAAIDEVQITAVPEPGSYALMLAGLGTLGLLVRRRAVR